MKKIKNFMIMLLVAMVSLCLTGCPDKPVTPTPDDKGSIVGEWECTMLEYSCRDSGEYDEGAQLFKNQEIVWMFDENENMIHFKDGISEGKYDYVVMNNKLYSDFFEDTFESRYAIINTLTSDKLSLTCSYESDDYDYWIEYTWSFKRLD